MRQRSVLAPVAFDCPTKRCQTHSIFASILRPVKSRSTFLRLIGLIILSLVLRGVPFAVAAPEAKVPAQVAVQTEAGCHEHETATASDTTEAGQPHQSACKISCELISAAGLLPASAPGDDLPRPVMIAHTPRLLAGVDTPPDHPPPI